MAESPSSSPDFEDDDPMEQAAWEIATAETLRGRGDLSDAANWYRRAVNHLMEGGDDERAVEIAKLAAELVALESAVRPASERERPVPSLPPPIKAATITPPAAPPAPKPTAPAVPGPGATKSPASAAPEASGRIFGGVPSPAASPASVRPPQGVVPKPGAPSPSVLPRQAELAKSPGPAQKVAPPQRILGQSLPPTAIGARTPSVAPPVGSTLPRPTGSVALPALAQSPAKSVVPSQRPSISPFSAAGSQVPGRAPTTARPPPVIRPSVNAMRPPAAPPDDRTENISLGAIASPIASLLDEAVANLEPIEQSVVTATKRPLSFLPQRAAEGESIAARLSVLPLFSELAPEKLRELSRQLIVETRTADEMLCQSGAPEGPLFVLLSGTAWVGLAGRASPVALVVAGDVVGEIAALFGGPRSATVIAREPMELVGIAPSLLRAMVRDCPGFREAILDVVRERLEESIPQISPALQRLPEEIQRALIAHMSFVEMREGDELLLEGELSTALFVIAAGEVECFGGELGVSRATRARMGELVGLASVLTAQPAGVSARAARAILVGRVERGDAREILRTHPALGTLLEDVAVPGRGVTC
ncbi:MAG: cyclic nucleotide-binding domain-containing protein [Deltaproteobacteria bacterium]|nr:cyclic nucleotide-binding domain-containing protein [Deltaproteobacteria bacterium]